jgi:hypothetical protein
MTGRGIKEKFLLFRPSRRGYSHWRETSFLYQLSMNGSMLWVPNHSRYWAEICSMHAGRSFSGWSALRRDLAERPAFETRKILYLSSRDYFEHLKIAWSESAKASLYANGELSSYLLSWQKDLERIGNQLDSLSWCLDDGDKGRIKVVDK